MRSNVRARVQRVEVNALHLTGSVLSLVALALLLLAPACSRRDSAATTPAPAPAAPTAQLLRISQRNEPATLDPHLATLPDEFFLIRALTEGLVVPNPNEGPPLPGVAERWETSPDGLTWTFHLRADARWSNGDPVTAADFVTSFRRALTPALGAPKAPLFFVLKNAAAFYRGQLADPAQLGIAAPDARTLVLTLEQPAPHLLALAASGPWLPVHPPSLEKSGGAAARDGTWTRPGAYVGNGPFTLTEWRKGQHLLVTRNPRYHAADRIALTAVRYQIYDSGDTEERAFRAGQVDITMAVPFTKLANYDAPVLRRQPLHETRYLALNTTRPPLDDARVRRALALALDRDALVRHVLRGAQRPALSFIPPGLGGYQPGEITLGSRAADTPSPPSAVAPVSDRRDASQRLALRDSSSSSSTKAEDPRALLADAGFPNGKNFPKLELAAWNVNPAILEAIQQMWRRELGIETSIVQREGKVHMSAVIAGDFAIALMPAIPDYDDPAALFDELTTGATGNYARWSNARYDDLARRARRETDRARRTELYRAAEQLLLAELPVVPLYFNSQDYLVAPRITGWRQDPLWNRFNEDVTLTNTDDHAAK
ncbi:MAG: peptide ABC transporter substrate-binding protein [Opitutae bacterium]|nr:peptide ABC transporter substrate-binding protein [Opitutae bacterium]